jgi:His-Xaa-Ser system radical SAM maturase HxsB
MKFEPLDRYTKSLDEGYKLLPFAFTALDDQRYVLTNLAGEYAVLDRPTLDDFVRHRLTPDKSPYPTLKSRHFLLDSDSSVPLDLLALKLRTKNIVFANFTALHLFVVTLRCEHSCPYCQVSRQNDDKVRFDMSKETADKAVALTFKSPSPSIKIEFQGGEPLLNFALIKHIVEQAETLNQAERRDLQFVIATNLACISDEMLDYCKVHDILISTSLDGPADLHNRNRPRPGGDSYQRTIAGINRVRNALGRDRVSALMTATEASLGRVKDIIDEYVRLGFGGIFLRPLSPYGFAIKTKFYSAYDVDKWLDFYFQGLDYIIELNKNGIVFTEFYASIILTKILTPFQTGYVDLRSPAGIGLGALVYNYDGDVYASDESRMLAEMGDRTFCLGNVHAHTWEQLVTSEALLIPLEKSFAGSVPMCSDCAFQPYCGSDPVFHHTTQGDYIGHKPSSAFCSRNMAIIRRLIGLLEGDRETADILKRWIRI